jgi:predicted RNA-binding protein with PIN domain
MYNCRMAAMKKNRVWIIDGHNLIFQVPHLRDLQVSGRRAEARRELEQLLLVFAGERKEEVVIVYDGNSKQSNPDTIQEQFLRTTYSLGFPEEVADHRILYLARQHAGHQKVCVVTSDLRTLARELDSTVTHLSVGEFWSRHVSPAAPAGSKEVSGDYSDIEAEFLRLDSKPGAEAAPAPRPRRSTGIPAPPPAPTKDVPTPPGKSAHKPAPGPPETAQQEKVRLKKERGRLRQARRLARYRRR